MTAITISRPQEAKGDYRAMLVRLMTRQFYAETATAEVFGRSISCAPTLREKFLAAEFAKEEADHSERLCRLLRHLGIDPEQVHEARPPAAQFWSLDLDNWIHIAVFNFTVDRAGSHQIMEYRDSSYLPWAREMEAVLADEEGHYGNGVENLRGFTRDKEVFAEFQCLYSRMLPVTVKRAFGRPNGADNDYCIAVGLKRHSTEQVVNRYLNEMLGYMRECGLKFPPPSAFETIGAELMPSTREIILTNHRLPAPVVAIVQSLDNRHGNLDLGLCHAALRGAHRQDCGAVMGRQIGTGARPRRSSGHPHFTPARPMRAERGRGSRSV